MTKSTFLTGILNSDVAWQQKSYGFVVNIFDCSSPRKLMKIYSLYTDSLNFGLRDDSKKYKFLTIDSKTSQLFHSLCRCGGILCVSPVMFPVICYC